MIRNKEAREAARAAGLDKFDLGVPCNNGHVSERYVSSGKCVSCMLETKRRQHLRNPDARSASDKAYYARNKAASSDRNRAYYEKNKDTIAEKGAAYRDENRDIVRQRHRDRYSENRTELRAKSSAIRAMRANRIVDWGIEHSEETRRIERELHAEAVRLGIETGESHSVDHMLPLMGRLVCGLHVWENLQVIPDGLNKRKINKFVLTEPNEWILAKTDASVMREPAWHRESVAFYKGLGWDFGRGEYTSGPYCAKQEK